MQERRTPVPGSKQAALTSALGCLAEPFALRCAGCSFPDCTPFAIGSAAACAVYQIISCEHMADAPHLA